jgi:hypothetical protein
MPGSLSRLFPETHESGDFGLHHNGADVRACHNSDTRQMPYREVDEEIVIGCGRKFEILTRESMNVPCETDKQTRNEDA